MGEAGLGAEEQATRRARRAAADREAAERAGAVDADARRRAQEDVRRWSAGAEGERIVAETLTVLGRYGWTTLHDMRWPGRQRANIDHIAIGPGGVVVIDAKNWSGDVRVAGSTLWQNAHAQTSKVQGAADAASAVTALLAPQHRTAVRAVVCLVAQEQQPVLADGGAVVLGRWQLPGHLLDLPVRLSVHEVAEIATLLDRELNGRGTAPAPAATKRGRRGTSSGRSGARPAARAVPRTAARAPRQDRRPARRTAARLVEVAFLIGLGLTAVHYLPQASVWFAGHLVTSVPPVDRATPDPTPVDPAAVPTP